MFPHHPSVYTNSAYRFLYIRVFNTLCTELRLHSLVGNLGSKLLLELVEDTLICAEVLRVREFKVACVEQM